MQFERAIQALCDAGVDFVVIGGLSATRATGREKDLSALPELESLLEAVAPEKQKPTPPG